MAGPAAAGPGLEVLRQLDLADSALDRAGREEGLAASGASEEARLALGRAEVLAGPRSDASTAARVRSVQERFASAARLRSLLADLEAARLGRMDVGLGPTDAAYLAAFRHAGHDPDRDAPRAASGVGLRARRGRAGLLPRRLGLRPPRRWAARGRLAAAGRGGGGGRPRPVARGPPRGVGRKDAGFAAAVRTLADDEGALDAQPATSLILLALQLKVNAGDLGRAVRVLERAWRRHPDDFWVNVVLADLPGVWTAAAREAYPRPEEAVRHLTAALAIRPGNLGCLINLGQALQSWGKLAEAEAAYREAIRLQPNLATAHHRLGGVLRLQGKPAEAEVAIRQAILLQPDSFNALTTLGTALADLGRLAEAETAHREAIRLHPDHAIPHTNLGVALLRQGKLAEAEAEFREAIRLGPDFAGAHNNLAFCLMSSATWPARCARSMRPCGLTRRTGSTGRPWPRSCSPAAASPRRSPRWSGPRGG